MGIPHFLAIQYPVQGHVNPLMQFSLAMSVFYIQSFNFQPQTSRGQHNLEGSKIKVDIPSSPMSVIRVLVFNYIFCLTFFYFLLSALLFSTQKKYHESNCKKKQRESANNKKRFILFCCQKGISWWDAKGGNRKLAKTTNLRWRREGYRRRESSEVCVRREREQRLRVKWKKYETETLDLQHFTKKKTSTKSTIPITAHITLIFKGSYYWHLLFSLHTPFPLIFSKFSYGKKNRTCGYLWIKPITGTRWVP